ncbi:PqqD family protein [Longibacter salinarum]|nr:PqqD family protein [Longibacter salinarum]
MLGFLNDTDASRLEALVRQVPSTVRDLRYVDYQQAETDCEVLAANLSNRLGADLEQARFAGLPRGGMIVLGMLSYALGLRPNQIIDLRDVEATSDGHPLVIVDDCVITGARIRAQRNRFVTNNASRRDLVVAALYATPALCDAVETDSAMRACIRARDVQDFTDERWGDHAGTYRNRWENRPVERYWTGVPEHVAFAWSEPDVGVWDEELGRVMRGLPVVSPSSCLKNRHATNPETRPPVFRQPETTAGCALGPHTFVAEVDSKWIIASTRSGVCMSMSGSSAMFWQALWEASSIDEAIERLADSFPSVSPASLRDDTRQFIGELVRFDVLQHSSSSAPFDHASVS